MSQFVLDDQLDVHEVLRPIQAWRTARLLREIRPSEHILDDRVPEILLTLRQPTFLTMDRGFCDSKLCHLGYCILIFEGLLTEQHLIPGLLRSLLRRPEFRTRGVRMGKVARITKGRIDYWEHSSQEVRHIDWQGAPRGKGR